MTLVVVDQMKSCPPPWAALEDSEDAAVKPKGLSCCLRTFALMDRRLVVDQQHSFWADCITYFVGCCC